MSGFCKDIGADPFLGNIRPRAGVILDGSETESP